MIKAGDIIRMKENVTYSITKAGTIWLVYNVNGSYLTIGTMPINGYKASDMIRLYGKQDNRQHIQRRWDSGVRLFEMPLDEVELAGNNALFKDKLLQGDMWEGDLAHKKITTIKPNETISCFLDDMPF